MKLLKLTIENLKIFKRFEIRISLDRGKYLKHKLLTDFDSKFWKQLADRYFRIRGINDILSDYKQNFSNDPAGKKLYMLLRRCAEEQAMTENIFLGHMCEFIYDYDGFNGLSQKLEKAIE